MEINRLIEVAAEVRQKEYVDTALNLFGFLLDNQATEEKITNTVATIKKITKEEARKQLIKCFSIALNVYFETKDTERASKVFVMCIFESEMPDKPDDPDKPPLPPGGDKELHNREVIRCSA